MARPTKLTAESRETVIALTRVGIYPKVAAERAGIHYNTLDNWLERGRAEEKRLNADPAANAIENEAQYLEFLSDYAHAEAHAEAVLASNIYNAAQNDPTLALKFMEKRWRERWGTSSKVDIEHSGKVSQVMEVDIDEDVRAATREFLAAVTRSSAGGLQ